MLKCAHCDKVYKYESERKRHQKSHFPQFGCKVCSKKFSFLSALRRHEKQHERTGSVHCMECAGTFRDDALLKRHMKYAHRGTFYCSKCPSTFSSDLALRTHLKIHAPESERRFHCKHKGCTKSFNFPHHLRHHELTHTKAKQHYCNVCGKGFIQTHHLKTHIKTHSPENWLKCVAVECHKKFITKCAWKKHIGTHTDIMKPHLPEIKFDSGISSDSSSASEIREKENIGDDVLCAFCGMFILRTQLDSHKLSCVKLEDSNQLLSNSRKDFANVKHGQVRAVNTPTYIKVKEHDSRSNNVSECDASLAPVVEAQRSKSVTNNNNYSGNVCKGCVCADDRSPFVAGDSQQNILTPKSQVNKSDFPEIEYRIDGIIKIRETFDSDIIVAKDPPKKIISTPRTEELKYVPFNSCKAVLGNCIVSEDGSIGEGCLCARMIVDEQQISAQEIDELTPNPNQCS